MSRSMELALLGLMLGFSTSLARDLLQGDSRGLKISNTQEFPQYSIEEVDFSHVITLKAPKTIRRGDRAPITLTAVLDRSSSMSGEKIELVKKSTEFMVQQLEEGDAIGVISYSTTVTEDAPMTPVTSVSKIRVREQIDEIIASGFTNLAGGLFAGIEQQLEYDSPARGVNTVLLLTDGLANRGITDIGGIQRQMDELLGSSGGPTVYTLGFGSDHDAGFLQAIARKGGASYVFIADESVVASSFGEILGGLLTTAAQNIEITLKPENGASIVSVKGGEVSTGSNVWITRIKDLFAEERRDILVNMKLPPVVGPVSEPVLTAKVLYFDVERNEDVEEEISIVVARKRARIQGVPATIVEVTRLRHEVAEAILNAISTKQSGATKAAVEILDRTLARLIKSSASTTPEVQNLILDIQKVKNVVSSKKNIGTSTALSFSAAATSIRTQRGLGSSGTFSSASTTTAQEAFAGGASTFVSSGSGKK